MNQKWIVWSRWVWFECESRSKAHNADRNEPLGVYASTKKMPLLVPHLCINLELGMTQNGRRFHLWTQERVCGRICVHTKSSAILWPSDHQEEIKPIVLQTKIFYTHQLGKKCLCHQSKTLLTHNPSLPKFSSQNSLHEISAILHFYWQQVHWSLLCLNDSHLGLAEAGRRGLMSAMGVYAPVKTIVTMTWPRIYDGNIWPTFAPWDALKRTTYNPGPEVLIIKIIKQNNHQ